MATPVGQRRLFLGAAMLFLGLAATYTFSIDIRGSRSSAITGDEPFYLMTTQSLLEDGDLDLTNQYLSGSYRAYVDYPSELWRQSVPLSDGRLLSPHNPGLSVLVIPGFVIAGIKGVQIQLLLLTAATFSLTYILVARLTARPLISWLATLAVGLSATSFIYSTEIYPEAPAALALIMTLLVGYGADKPGPWRSAMVALCLSAMPWLGVKYAILTLPVAAYLLLRASKSGRAAMVGAGTLMAALYAWFHWNAFGALTPYGSNVVYAGFNTWEILGAHLAFADRLHRITGLFIDQRFGIGRWAPVLLAAIPSLALLWRRDGFHRLVLVLFALGVLVATFVAITMMGWWFPGRMLMVVLPLLALPLAILGMKAGSFLRLALIALGIYSAAVTAALAVAGLAGRITIAVDPFDMPSPLFRFPAPLFPDYGFTGISTVTLSAGWLVLGFAAGYLALKSDGHDREGNAIREPRGDL